MQPLFKKTSPLASRLFCAMLLFALFIGPVVNASTDISSMCNNMSADAAMDMSHDTMSNAPASTEDCCAVDVMPDCCNSCNASVFTFSTQLVFSTEQLNATHIAPVVQQLSSIISPPLLRPPTVS
ncbi:MAG: hypothetical protein ABGX33_07900 [Cycloclasticus sp.]